MPCGVQLPARIATKKEKKMKTVLLSIQPQWCAMIANRKKTIEVRKLAEDIAEVVRGEGGSLRELSKS